MDGALVFAFGKTFALEIFPFKFVDWEESFCDTDATHCLPFGPTPSHPYGQVLSLGYVATHGYMRRHRLCLWRARTCRLWHIGTAVLTLFLSRRYVAGTS